MGSLVAIAFAAMIKATVLMPSMKGWLPHPSMVYPATSAVHPRPLPEVPA